MQNEDESCGYKRANGSAVVFLVLDVIDIILIGNDVPAMQGTMAWLGKCFARKDTDEAAYILGIKIYRNRPRRMFGLSQSTYIDKILKRFLMHQSKRDSFPGDMA